MPDPVLAPQQVDALDAAVNNATKQQAFGNVLAMLGLAAVTGGGARALLGRKYLFGSGLAQPAVKMPETVVPIPYPVYSSEREEDKARRRLGLPRKAAAFRLQLPAKRANEDDTFASDIGVTLSANDAVRVYAPNGNLTFTLIGQPT